MKNLYLIFTLALLSFTAAAQNKVNITGMVLDTAGTPMPYSTVSILNPSDSTLAFFGITNAEGSFKVANVQPGNYVLQASYLGFANQYLNITEEQLSQDLNIGVIKLGLKAVSLDGVEITGTQAPILIKNDTIEYNASSFRSKPNDNVEALLKKMPGIEVDRDGNIKAQGEDVQKVTVDGKEFFGNDPKMATRNLPADAVKKVQVFDKKSDVAEFTGVDDGERSKTINLELKEDKKKGTFGEIKAGYGTDDRYELGGSAFNFNPKRQLSFLGRQNNVNDYGFSINDYLNFQGGMQSGNVRLTINGNDNTVPLNFGQTQNGNLSSGALGANASFELKPGNDLNISYMLNGSDRFTNTNGSSTQFTPQGSLNIEEQERQNSDNMSHLGSLRWINDLDSLTRVIITGSANITDAGSTNNSFRESNNENDENLNTNRRALLSNSDGYNLSGSANWVKKSAHKLGRNLSAKMSLGLSNSIAKTNWDNQSTFAPDPSIRSENYFRKDQTDQNSITVGGEWNEPIFNSQFIELGMTYKLSNNEFFRDQTHQVGENNPNINPTDKVSQNASDLKAGVQWKYINEKTTLSAGVDGNWLDLSQEYLQAETTVDKAPQQYFYLLPSVRLRHRFDKSKRLNFSYNTSVNYPNVSSIAPIADLTNPLFINTGNLNLTPEYQHAGRLFYMLYDAFTFTSLFLNANVTHTNSKIIQTRTIDPNTFIQTQTPINYKDAQNYSVGLNFSTPISKLGLKVSIGLDEEIGNGYSLINNVENQLTTYGHSGDISIGNKKKEKFDVSVGTAISYTDARYSINTNQNTIYQSNSYFADASWFISDSWVITSQFDYTTYRNSQIGNSVSIPLLQASVTHSCLKGNRGSLTLKAFDLLDKNSGVEQYSSENVIGQQITNVLQQYYMLSFTYKLSAMAKDPVGAMHFRIRR